MKPPEEVSQVVKLHDRARHPTVAKYLGRRAAPLQKQGIFRHYPELDTK